jgi:hypothetical protein
MRNNSSIFRPEALQHYFHKRERAVFPIYTRPRTALCAVLLALILAAGVLLAAVIRVPIYARGVAVPIEVEAATRSSETVEVALFVPAEILSKLEAGQKVFLRDGATAWRDGGRIKTYGAPFVPAPDSLPDGISKEPAAVALVGPVPAGHATPNDRPDVLEVRIEIGERPLLSFENTPIQ